MSSEQIVNTNNKNLISNDVKIVDIDGLKTFKDLLNNEIKDKITNNELVISAALNDLNKRKQEKLISGTNIKTINGESIIGSGDITITSAGYTDANVQAVDTEDIVDDVNVSYATTAYVDELVGDINSVLENIING